MTDELNDYFAPVFTVEDAYKIQNIVPAKPNLIPLSDSNATEDAVTKTFVKIEVNKNSGPDYIIFKRGKVSNQQTNYDTIQ